MHANPAPVLFLQAANTTLLVPAVSTALAVRAARAVCTALAVCIAPEDVAQAVVTHPSIPTYLWPSPR